MNKVPKHSGLFRVSDDGEKPPPLIGRRCKNCGFIIFPPQDYGCEQCGKGAEYFETVDLQGRGVLKSFAFIHGKPKPGRPPAVFGEVILDDGPVVQTMIACRDKSELSIGSTVLGVFVEKGKDDNGNIVIDYFFTVDKG